MNPPPIPSDELCRRHHLSLMGSGDTTLLLVHGYGCSQRVWRHLAPVLADRYRVVLIDLVGFGDSDAAAYQASRYQGLEGHAQDVADIGRALGPGRTVLVGHCVAAMVGVLADALAPEAFAAHVMVAPFACMRNEGSYRGGFDAAHLDALVRAQDDDWHAWARTVTGWATGLPTWQPVVEELNDSFCRADRRAARALARASFLGDYRAALPGLAKPTLVLQGTQDPVASEQVGAYITASVERGELRLVDSVGHFPHLTAPRECLREIEQFLERTEPA